MAKKTTSKPAKKKTAEGKPAKKKPQRTRWLDPQTNSPLLHAYAGQMQSFLKAMADGVIEENELEEQEKEVAALMAEIEPRLDDELHEKVTRLLCEVTVYDMMQMMLTMNASRRATKFKG